MNKFLLPLSVALAVTSTPLFASDSEHELKHHLVGAILGITDAESSEPTYGIEYEYRFDQHWGVGAVWEKTPEAHASHDGHQHRADDVSVYLASGYWHQDSVRLGLGFGKEKVHGEHSSTESLIRASAAYDFHLTASMAVAPEFCIDRVDGEYIQVYGLTLLYAF